MNSKHMPPTRSRSSRRKTRGSVLILVVALLVLMALIGTAWISTTRVDRAAAVQTVNNTQIDLLVDSVVNIAKSGAVADVAQAGFFRGGPGYAHSDAAVTDDFLAARVPQLLDEVAPQ